MAYRMVKMTLIIEEIIFVSITTIIKKHINKIVLSLSLSLYIYIYIYIYACDAMAYLTYGSVCNILN